MTKPSLLIRGLAALLAAPLVGLAMAPAAAATLDSVKARGTLNCGVNEGLLGFAAKDAAGHWAGFDVDFCKAVAVAVLGDASKVAYVPLSASDRFAALKDGRVDLLSRNSTWTLEREADLGVNFTAVTYYDGQGFMVRRTSGHVSALELDGAKVCVQAGTTTEPNFIAFFEQNGMKYTEVSEPSTAAAVEAYRNGACDTITSDVSQLYAIKASLPEPGDSVILPDVISKEPLGPAVRSDDPAWRLIVQWVAFALLDAEELGVSSDRLDAAKASKKGDVMSLVGTTGDLGAKLGLTNDFAVRIVGAVGNYGEIFERNLGADSPLAIPRGLNQLWTRGGIQYAPPFR